MDTVTIDVESGQCVTVEGSVPCGTVFIYCGSQWSMLTPTQARALIAALQQAVREVEEAG